jgi:hypothetical protein
VFFIDNGGYVEDAIFYGPDYGNHLFPYAIQDVTQDNGDGLTWQAAPYAPLAAVARKVDLTGCGNRDNEFMDVFTVATDGVILHNVWNVAPNASSPGGGNWDPTEVTRVHTKDPQPSPTGEIGVVSPWPGAMYVGATRTDGSLATIYFKNPPDEKTPWQSGL